MREDASGCGGGGGGGDDDWGVRLERERTFDIEHGAGAGGWAGGGAGAGSKGAAELDAWGSDGDDLCAGGAQGNSAWARAVRRQRAAEAAATVAAAAAAASAAAASAPRPRAGPPRAAAGPAFVGAGYVPPATAGPAPAPARPPQRGPPPPSAPAAPARALPAAEAALRRARDAAAWAAFVAAPPAVITTSNVPFPTGPHDDVLWLGEGASKQTVKEVRRDALLKWHPDKFCQRFGSRLGGAREAVLARVKAVAQAINAIGA